MKNKQNTEPYTHLKTVFEKKIDCHFNDWSAFSEKFHLKTFTTNEHWIKAGEFCDDMCFILKGILRVYYIDRSGNEINQHFYQANEVLSPISALISDEPCQYYIQALEPCELMLANYHDLNNISIVQPQWLQLEVKLLQTVFIKNAKREAQLLLGNAEQRYKWFLKEFPELNEKLPQYHIASFLGITPVSLSRLRKKIQV
ncbi:Crp/Fnr family transcriptional regulator [Pseudoalteromonas denitrificans]|uniref:cAMP-binding domain of CRP or a regulatory subunit of cAMP-dependent protein kinases n=1 Tax=Pseudoalteromonas denitrificans DSM 6059 TaxID=1123010 RepID=A0A1I1RXF2_9GAMM|nr:Crp/Fnr family transcriptional regulator [Pseudoalteromonas denitrificans]SFD38777.1 cAMP-binding domain of CRP or a regulatory subunit of cAMP-dependent protein kinases [Pseudoalteromonas denitrificans DSM 6059]